MVEVNVHFNLPSDLPPPDVMAKLDALAKTAKDILISRGYRRIEIIGSPPSNTDLITTAAASPARSSSSSNHSLSPSITSDQTTITLPTATSLLKTTLTIFGMTCASCIVRAVHDPLILPIEKLSRTIENAGYDVLATDSEMIQVRAEKKKGGGGERGLGIEGLEGLERVGVKNEDGEGVTEEEGVKDSQGQGERSPKEVVTRLLVSGMTCTSCVASVETAVKARFGVQEVSVNLMTNEAHIKHDPTTIGPRDLLTLITSLGYNPTLLPSSLSTSRSLQQQRSQSELASLRKQVIIAFILAFPVF
ncbi:ATPase Cu transporting protein 7A [Quaeritorhiza haematococci]|nr:ATPase Cu transporting protein 7A [Quaeritorhiza haematococci]